MTDQQAEAPLLSHLVELRNRILHALSAVLIVFLALVYFANDIYAYVSAPLIAVLPDDTSMIATNVAAPFFAPIKLTLAVSLFVAMPFVLYQVWRFIAPGLYTHEKRLVMPLVATSALLFYAGVAFVYFVVFPLAFGFFASVAPEGVTIATDISSYLDFVLKLFFAFGLAFEIPVATLLLCWTGVVTPEQLRGKRPYIIVSSFVIGMLMTPPDIISQTLLAIPMILLFELGLLFSRFYVPKDENASVQDENQG